MAEVKSLDVLIKIRERELDMLRRRMSVLENQKDKFHEEIARLAEELKKERDAAKDQLDMLPFLQQYQRKNAEETRQYEQAITRLEGQIEEMNEVIRKIFSELKKLEIAKEQQLAAIAEDERLKENKQMDELAQIQHQRKGES